MNGTGTQAYMAEWRAMEDRFYRSILAGDLYMLGIRLVRAIAETLAPAEDLETLVARFQRTTTGDVIPIADALEAPQVLLLDYQLALGAAFYLRARELQEAAAGADLRERIEAARAQGQTWVLLADRQTRRYGKAMFQRLEMRLPDGFGIYTASELDWEKGWVYVLQPLRLDPRTGRRSGATSLGLSREYATLEELQQAAGALRRPATRERTLPG